MSDDLVLEFEAAAEEVLVRLMSRASVREAVLTHGFSQEAWSTAADAGWFGVLLESADGGLGLDLRTLAPIFRAAGRHLLPGPLLEHAVAAPLAAQFAVGEARVRLLAAVAGQRRIALADGRGADATLALDRGVLTGRCPSVRFAEMADDLLVFAQTAQAEAAIALLPLERQGIEITPQISLDPTTSFADVAFDGVSVDSQDIVAADSGGPPPGEVTSRIRIGLQLMIACTLAGMAAKALEMSVAYAKGRQQFGRPIGAFQAIQHLLAEMACQTIGLDSLCRYAAAASSDARASSAGLVAKAHAGRVARSVLESALQIHGGIAFTLEHDLHLYYKHVLCLECFYGPPAELEMTLGQDLLTSVGNPWVSW